MNRIHRNTVKKIKGIDPNKGAMPGIIRPPPMYETRDVLEQRTYYISELGGVIPVVRNEHYVELQCNWCCWSQHIERSEKKELLAAELAHLREEHTGEKYIFSPNDFFDIKSGRAINPKEVVRRDLRTMWTSDPIRHFGGDVPDEWIKETMREKALDGLYILVHQIGGMPYKGSCERDETDGKFRGDDRIEFFNV